VPVPVSVSVGNVGEASRLTFRVGILSWLAPTQPWGFSRFQLWDWPGECIRPGGTA
jgi:hypothetical protein